MVSEIDRKINSAIFGLQQSRNATWLQPTLADINLYVDELNKTISEVGLKYDVTKKVEYSNFLKALESVDTASTYDARRAYFHHSRELGLRLAAAIDSDRHDIIKSLMKPGLLLPYGVSGTLIKSSSAATQAAAKTTGAKTVEMSGVLKKVARIVGLSTGVGVLVDVVTSPEAIAEEDYESRLEPEIINGQRVKPSWELDSQTKVKYQKSTSPTSSAAR